LRHNHGRPETCGRPGQVISLTSQLILFKLFRPTTGLTTFIIIIIIIIIIITIIARAHAKIENNFRIGSSACGDSSLLALVFLGFPVSISKC